MFSVVLRSYGFAVSSRFGESRALHELRPGPEAAGRGGRTAALHAHSGRRPGRPWRAVLAGPVLWCAFPARFRGWCFWSRGCGSAILGTRRSVRAHRPRGPRVWPCRRVTDGSSQACVLGGSALRFRQRGRAVQKHVHCRVPRGGLLVRHWADGGLRQPSSRRPKRACSTGQHGRRANAVKWL